MELDGRKQKERGEGRLKQEENTEAGQHGGMEQMSKQTVNERSFLRPGSSQKMTLEEKFVSGRPELTAFHRAATAVVSLCQHVVIESPGGFNTIVMNSVENKLFLTPPTSTGSSITEGSE